MKIRSQLVASALLAVAVGLAAGLAVWLAAAGARAAEAERQRAQAAARETAGLLVLTQEYAQRFEPRAAQQWHAQHATIVGLLGHEGAGDPFALAGPRRAGAALGEMFARLSELADAPATPLAQRRKEFLVDRMLAETQALSDGVYRWSREAAAAQRAADRRERQYGIAAFGITFVLLLAQTLLVWRRVLRPVAQLERANASVQHGALDVQLRADSRDELGDLQRSFNAMTAALEREAAARRLSEERIVASEKRLRDITNNIPALIGYFDVAQRCQFANGPALRMHGIAAEAASSHTLRSALGEANYALHEPHLPQVLAGKRAHFEGSVTMGGRLIHYQAHLVPDVGADGAVNGFYLMSFDITKQKDAEQARAADVVALRVVEARLHQLARVDELTGLPNRRQLEEKLAQALARSRREQRPMALLFLDVDRFKQINDAHGHGVGDAVLKEFAERLRQCVRITDTVARLAGDEFLIVLEGLHVPDEAELVAAKIGRALQPAFGEAAMRLAVRSSIGVAYVEDRDLAPADLIARADQALYQAKRAGRGTYAVSRRETPEPLRRVS